jgi:hypothetical protein
MARLLLDAATRRNVMNDIEGAPVAGLIALDAEALDLVSGGYLREIFGRYGGLAATSAVATAGLAAASTPVGRGVVLAGMLTLARLPTWMQAGIGAAGAAAWKGLDYAGGKAGEYVGGKLDHALGWDQSSPSS